MPATYYTTVDEVKRLGNAASVNETNVVRDALILEMLPRVDAIIDRATGTFFRSETATYWMRPKASAKRLYMPAPIISLTSVSERGAVLSAASAYIVGGSSRVLYWIEKYASIGAGSPAFGWATEPYSDGTAMREPVKVVGSFGYAAVPGDINQVATELCAILSGIKTKTFFTGDGVQQTINLSNAPDYAKQVLGYRTWFSELSGQVCHQ